MKISIVWVILLSSLCSVQLLSQSSLSGHIIGEDDESLMSATVVLLSQTDSTLVSFSLSDKNGDFLIKDVENGAYVLQVTFIGYKQYSKSYEVKESGAIDLGNIKLEINKNQLKQVEIKGEHVPMVVKKDTLEYNAAAFQTQPHEMVEDLLKKLPGVEVESDGNIKAQGEDVQSVLVDGKEFFGNDPKIATKNLPADAVDKVQIFDRMSDMSEFSGVDDGERIKTIDLKLKEDKKNGQFGNVEAGYGTEERYKGRFSYNRFSKKLQFSAIGNFNNINEQGFSSGDYINFVRGIGGNWGRLNDNGISMFNGLSDGFVTTHAGGLNLNYDLSSKVELTASYFLNSISNDIESIVQREEFVREGSFFDLSTVDQVTESDNHRLVTEIDVELDSSQNLRLRTNLSYNEGGLSNMAYNERTDFDNIKANTSDQEYTSDGESSSISGSLTYRKKIGKVKKRVLTLSGGLNTDENNSDGDLSTDNTFFPDDPSEVLSQLIFQDQLQNNDKLNYNVRLSYVEPLKNGTFLELKYRRQNYDEDLLYDVYDVLNGDRTYNDLLSNSYNRNFGLDRIGLAWHKNTDKTALTLETMVQNSLLEGEIITSNDVIRNRIIRVLPRVSLRHELGNSSNIRLRYSTSVNEPSLEQLQPIVDNSDPLNIYIGNPTLRPEYRHTLRINYMHYDEFSFRSFFAFANIRFAKNKIENQTLIGRDFVRTTQPVNINNDLTVSGNLNFSTPLNFLKTRWTLGTRTSYSNGTTFLNGFATARNRVNGNINMKIENRNKSNYNVVIGGSWNYNVTNYDSDAARSQQFFSQNLYTDIRYNIKRSFSLSTSMDVNFYSEEEFGEQRTVPVWKASISKYLLANQRVELKLSAFDILNQNLGISRRTGSNFIQNSEITSLGRFYMLSVLYSLNSQRNGANRGRSGGGMRRR